MDHSQKAALIATSYLLTATRTYIPMGMGIHRDTKNVDFDLLFRSVKIDSYNRQILNIFTGIKSLK